MNLKSILRILNSSHVENKKKTAEIKMAFFYQIKKKPKVKKLFYSSLNLKSILRILHSSHVENKKKTAQIKMAFLYQIKKKPKIKKLFLIIFEPGIDF